MLDSLLGISVVPALKEPVRRVVDFPLHPSKERKKSREKETALEGKEAIRKLTFDKRMAV